MSWHLVPAHFFMGVQFPVNPFELFLTAVSTIMIFIPWSILLLRINFQWALDYADIMLPCYAGVMIFSGVFTILSYFKSKVQNNLMKVCLIVNSLYAAGGAEALGMIVLPKIM